MRRVFFLAALGILFFASQRAAQAAFDTVVCPAHVAHVVSVQNSQTTYAFNVKAGTSGTVEGTIDVNTDRGWYQVVFPAQTLQPGTFNYSYKGAQGSYSTFVSPIMRVTFPQPVRVLAFFVATAAPKGDAIGSEDLGLVRCDPYVGTGESDFAGSPAYKTAGDDTLNLRAQSVVPIFNTNCTSPFREALLIGRASLQYPEHVIDVPHHPQAAKIEIRVGPDGKVDQAQVFQSSGDVLFDNAALEAAKANVYLPKVVYCIPVHGVYLVPEVYNPAL